MANAQKPDFVFRRNGRVHLNRWGRQFSRLLAAEVCAFSGSNAGYTMFRSSVKSTVYPLHSPVSPSLPLPYVTVCHHISTGFYVGPWPSMRAVGTRSQWPGQKSGKCTRVGMFTQINLSCKERDNYSLGTLSSAHLVSHLSNIPAVGKPLEIRDVTNPFFYSSVYYLSYLVL